MCDWNPLPPPPLPPSSKDQLEGKECHGQIVDGLVFLDEHPKHEKFSQMINGLVACVE